MEKVISVIVPVYNAGDTIGSCVESILRQAFADLELILVDDGSTDQGGAVCDDYAARDPRIVVVHQSNRGRTEARAVGTWRAQGQWLCYVDADDTLPADSLSLLYSRATADVDIVLGNGHTLTGEGRATIPMDEFRHLAVRAEGTIGVPWGSLYRRSVLTPWLFDVPRHIVNGEDYLFWLRLVFSTERPVAVVYESVYDKGPEHTSNSFVWTADYCQELNRLRLASIPADRHKEYAADMLSDRLENLYAVAVWSRRQTWAHSAFYRDILSDLRATRRRLPLRVRLFLSLPSLWLRRKAAGVNHQ